MQRAMTVALVTCVAACDSGSPLVAGKATFLRGPSPTTSTVTRPAPAIVAPLADGDWLVSPDEVTTTVTRALLTPANPGPQISVDLGTCAVDYSVSKAALATIGQCDLLVPPGTYTQISLEVPAMWGVAINDPLHGMYTNGTGVATVPAGGTPPSPLQGANAINASFATPVTVDDGVPLDLTIVMSGFHTVVVHVAGGAPIFQVKGSRILDAFITNGPITASQFYTSASSPGNINTGTEPAPSELLVLYTDAMTPAYSFVQPGAALDACKSAGSGLYGAMSAAPHAGSTAGGYLGLDGTGNLCWALPADPSYAAYQSLWKAPKADAIGSPAALACQTSTTAPAPASGTTYSGGCPALTPTATANVTLVAK